MWSVSLKTAYDPMGFLSDAAKRQKEVEIVKFLTYFGLLHTLNTFFMHRGPDLTL